MGPFTIKRSNIFAICVSLLILLSWTCPDAVVAVYRDNDAVGQASAEKSNPNTLRLVHAVRSLSQYNMSIVYILFLFSDIIIP